MQPMYALHKSREGAVVSANAFRYDYELSSWLRSLDIRPGDKIEFDETGQRDAEPEPIPAIETPPPAPAPAAVGDDMPF